jgi:hypothetical protein
MLKPTGGDHIQLGLMRGLRLELITTSRVVQLASASPTEVYPLQPCEDTRRTPRFSAIDEFFLVNSSLDAFNPTQLVVVPI